MTDTLLIVLCLVITTLGMGIGWKGAGMLADPPRRWILGPLLAVSGMGVFAVSMMMIMVVLSESA